MHPCLILLQEFSATWIFYKQKKIVNNSSQCEKQNRLGTNYVVEAKNRLLSLYNSSKAVCVCVRANSIQFILYSAYRGQ